MKKVSLLLGLLFAAIVLVAQPTTVEIQDQKMLVSSGEQSYVLAPNGDDASYFWASVSPDGKHVVYVTAKGGTFVCDINGDNVRSLGRMNAPKWLNNNQIAGMQEFYTGHDEIDHVRYISCNINTKAVRELSEMERTIFINAENQRLDAARKEQAARIAARKEATAARTDLSGLKIYVNAGHGGYDKNDRSCWTIPVPETWTNPEGYWESKSNLVKALHLEEMLKKSGATVIMSRRTNNSGIRDLEYYPNATEAEKAELRKGDDRDLSAIAEEANANKVDHFLSIHTNALNASTNYLLMLFRGENDNPTTAPSDEMAAHSGNIQIQNQLTVWTSANPMVRGDLTFYGDGMGLGVLRPLTVPGFLSEGSFHDYAPETHRLMNDDYCKLEALRLYQHFHKWFGAPLPQTATISGWVKSSNELVDILGHKQFVYVKNSDDQWLPLNGAKVELYKGSNKVAEKTTDDWYNGIFAFYDLEPGTYKLVVTKANYATVTEEITVKAEEIGQVKVRMKNIRMHMEDYPEGESDVVAVDNYEFELVGEKSSTPNNITRALYRNGKCYVLADGKITEYSLDFATSTSLTMPLGVTVSDMGFTADNYLVAKAKDKGVFYTWGEDMKSPTKLFEVSNVKGNSFAVSGARWESKYYLGEGNTMYKVVYNEDTNKATVTTETAAEDLTDKQLTIMPQGTVSAVNGASFLRYAGHSYMAKPTGNADQFQLYDVTEGVASAKVVSSVYASDTEDAPNTQTMAWVDGYIMHVMTIADGHGMKHYQTLTSPVANIYAGEVDYDGKNFTFRLNEDATDVTISIEKNNEVVATQSVGALKKGANKVANPFGKTEFDYYSITATTRPVAYPAKISNDDEIFQFYAPRGVAVDKTPASPYFGRVYVTNSVAGQCVEGAATSYRNSSMGVYVLGSDFTDVTNQGNDAWSGNVEWGENNTSTNYQWALSRPAVAPNGDLFVASSSFTSAGVYIMEAAKPNASFIQVFDGKRSKSNGQLKKGSKVVCNPVMQPFITGLGKDEVLYTYDRDCSMGTVRGNIAQYNLGQLDSLPWATEATKQVYTDVDNFMENGSGQIAYDQHGGFFLSQYRYNSSWAKPALLHVNKNGEIDFNISNNGVDAAQQGGMAVNADGTLLAMGTEYCTVKLWSIEYNNEGAPILTELYTIVWGDGQYVTMGLDFDAAGNLYIVSNTNERLMVYALPNTNNTYTTRVPLNRETYPRVQKGDQPEEDPGEDTGVRKAGLNAYASGISSTDLATDNKYIISYTLNDAASGLELQLLDANKKTVTSIPMNQPENRTKGSHRVEVEFSGIASGTYNWALNVKSLPLANNEPLCAVDNLPEKMLASKGLAIDNDYNSPYFGQLYVAEASGDKVLENKAIYIYDAMLEVVEKVTSDKWAAAVSAPCRVTVGPDHQLYICEWADVYPNNAYIMDPANTSVLTPIFGGNEVAGGDKGIYTTADGKDIHGSISHIWVEGTGADRVIYTFDEDINMEGLKNPMGLYQYNIGELATPWEQAPSKLVFDNADFLQQNGNSFIQPDAYGWWISQDRASDNAEIPALIHINKEGQVDFNSAGTLGGRTRGALGFNKDMTQLATAITNGIIIWNIKYDASGVPTLEEAGRLESTFNQTCWNIVFDVAGNIYASGTGSINAWAMPSVDNSCLVNAPDTDLLTIVSTAVENVQLDNNIVKTGIYTVTGQYLGTDESNLPQGLYIINGKKVIK